jgi:dTMP kinase
MEENQKQNKLYLERGILVSFEGIEGSGKSTQAEKAHSVLELKGLKCVFTREPGGTGLSEKIRPILLDESNAEMTSVCELFLYLASRSQNVSQIIKPALDTKSIVIADRFSDSTRAYQGAGRGLDIEMIGKLNDLATEGLKPDITFLLDIDPAEGLRRSGAKDRIELEEIGFHTRVRTEFLKIAEEEPSRVIRIDGEDEVDSIHKQVMTLISQRISLKTRSHED